MLLRSYTFPFELGGVRATAGRRFLQVELTLENTGSESPLPAGSRAFTLDSLSGTTYAAERTELATNPCSDATLALRQSRTCDLVFELSTEARPADLTYDTGTKQYTASFDGLTAPPMLCAEPSAESTPAACSDGCNNDGDPYLDCDDADCCSIRPDCPTGTYCGGSPVECTTGPENTVDRCRDACDNEGNGAIDCADPACCDLVACAPETLCGAQPDPFGGALPFDDTAIGSLDPTTLRAGASPCHAPALVTVDWVDDGDTIEVSGAIEGPVRLIGVDTPEISHGGLPADCYGDEASEFTRQLRGHRVWLTFDAECFDQYERNLAYVHLNADSVGLYERQLLRRGFARTLTVRPNDTFEALFGHDQALAAGAGAGLWTACP